MEQLDGYDLKILAQLQDDGRLTNNELSERIALSPSQCSRRRARLETEGFIHSYRAMLDRGRLGLDLMVVIAVTLATHNRDNAKRFAALIADLPEVLECYALTGEMDYHLKVVTYDLAGLSHFVNEVLLPHDSVQHVKTSIVLATLKDFQGLPVRQRGRPQAGY
ncbi:Lrp/AsnC family transcriptional regulator [Pararhizobium sp. BT-229]|uniref:Lrp/AsnC family transcriptional regulator n=1 Tax=Pararhizobium sp. BT-229 TaxID=2986923 RepID=UPI0021F6DEF7|nr:Lrp/AsnC family transcriptional regulator [Pararhizobium sp. BT-229]MCV9966460.1 Lrp/AsnC family transcriptional regulator [Pararhizobium sp. BT-229]